MQTLVYANFNSLFQLTYFSKVQGWLLPSKVRVRWNQLYVHEFWEKKRSSRKLPFFIALPLSCFPYSNLLSPKLSYNLDTKRLSKPNSIILVMVVLLLSFLVFCRVDLLLSAIKCFVRTSKKPNLFMWYSTSSLPQKCSRLKFYFNGKRKISLQLLHFLLYHQTGYQIQVRRPMKTKTAYLKRNYNIARALVLSNHGQKSWTNSFLAITAEIHACSLGIFYGQYADRHMNLKLMAHVSERERAIRQFIIVKNKFMWVFNVSILLLTISS